MEGRGVADRTNPWLSKPPVDPEPTTPPVVADVSSRPTGPASPQRGVPAPDRVDQLPTVAHHRTGDLWWLGVHGGAGESTLAGLQPTWPAAEHAWPHHPPGSDPAHVVLVARSNMRGLRAAQTASTQWASGLVPFVEVLGLVIIMDAPGRLPRPLREYAQVVAGGVPRVWRLPWVEPWRMGEPVVLDDAPRAVRRLVDELSVLIGAPSTTNRKEES